MSRIAGQMSVVHVKGVDIMKLTWLITCHTISSEDIVGYLRSTVLNVGSVRGVILAQEFRELFKKLCQIRRLGHFPAAVQNPIRYQVTCRYFFNTPLHGFVK